MINAVCVLNDSTGKVRGLVKLRSTPNGVYFGVKLWGVPPGKHGFHVHRSGDLSHGSHSLCEHYSSPGRIHGNLNDDGTHEGDLGNLVVREDGTCDTTFVAKYLQLEGDVRETIIGRSLVVHSLEDDLGLGTEADSKINGHSGARLLYGIIGVSGNDRASLQGDDGCIIL